MRIEIHDRAGLEHLLRYFARPAFDSERLTWDGPDQPVRYTLPKPLPSRQTELTLAPLERLDRLAALIPPPRCHRHHYFGVHATRDHVMKGNHGRGVGQVWPAVLRTDA